METLFDEPLAYFMESSPDKLFVVIVLIIQRPLGFLFGFVVFGWAFKRQLVIRISMAIVLGLPALFVDFSALREFTEVANVGKLTLAGAKEFAIGYLIGFLGSLAFFALKYAGAITDNFRGENDTGLFDPQDDPLHTFSALYLVIGFFAFFSMGGFEVLIDNLYQSYLLWPLGDLFPEIDRSTVSLAGALLVETLWLAFKISLPLLAVLLMIEFGVSIGARLARRYNFYELAFPLKNLIAVVSMPIVVLVVWNFSDQRFRDAGSPLDLIEVFLR